MKKLKFLEESEPYKDPRTGRNIKMWKMKCFCCNEFISRKNAINTAATKSCGCLYKTAKMTHKLSKHPLHNIWNNIKQRCYNSNRKGWLNYGGRGVVMCEDWKINFISFYKWANANKWESGLEIDRINNDGNYEPQNCQIVSRSKNNRNKRTNKMIEYKGEIMCLTEWCEKLDLKYQTIEARLRYSWSIPDCFEKPIIHKRK